MTEFLASMATADFWASLFTLTLLEVVLGVDNLLFLAILSNRLPPEQQSSARKLGLAMACGTRILLLLTIAYIAALAQPLFNIGSFAVSIRDLVLILGGGYLVYKGGTELWEMVELNAEETAQGELQPGAVAAQERPHKPVPAYWLVIVQIAIIDIVFSLDSVITAVGLTNNKPIMVMAIMFAIGIMIFAADALAAFIEKNPSVKILALGFLVLVGTILVIDGLHIHLSKAYLYFALGFACVIEAVHWRFRRNQARLTTPP
jgi:predicted tellurium resistance membrane protein TerC